MQIIGLQNRFIGELHNPSSNFYDFIYSILLG